MSTGQREIPVPPCLTQEDEMTSLFSGNWRNKDTGEFLNPNNYLVLPNKHQLQIPFQSSWESGKQTATLPHWGLFLSAALLGTFKSNPEMETELGGSCPLAQHGPAITAALMDQSRHCWWLKLRETMKAEGILSPLEQKEQDRGTVIPQQMAWPRKPRPT